MKIIKKIIINLEKIFKKIIEKKIYYKEYQSITNFNKIALSYIKIKKLFSFKDGVYYCVSLPNISYSCSNLIDALLKVLENESIGMAKYNIVKELLYAKNIKNFHY
jgi:hypothetical protein